MKLFVAGATNGLNGGGLFLAEDEAHLRTLLAQEEEWLSTSIYGIYMDPCGVNADVVEVTVEDILAQNRKNADEGSEEFGDYERALTGWDEDGEPILVELDEVQSVLA